MSREIKFRYLITGSNGIPIMSVFPLEGLVDDLIMLDHIRAKRTIKFCGEYTGLCDKSGKEIYEGDIVEVDNGNVLTECNFETGQFNLFNPVGGGYWTRQLYHHPERLTVIGNIHESYELLKQ